MKFPPSRIVILSQLPWKLVTVEMIISIMMTYLEEFLQCQKTNNHWEYLTNEWWSFPESAFTDEYHSVVCVRVCARAHVCAFVCVCGVDLFIISFCKNFCEMMVVHKHFKSKNGSTNHSRYKHPDRFLPPTVWHAWPYLYRFPAVLTGFLFAQFPFLARALFFEACQGVLEFGWQVTGADGFLQTNWLAVNCS